MLDVVAAFRSFRARPLFALAVLLLLGLGIGATTAVFSVVHGLVLRPLPFPEPERLVRVYKNYVERDLSEFPLSYPELVRWREASTRLESAAGLWWFDTIDATLVVEQAPRHIRVAPVTSNYFDVLGASALVGRTFEPGDDAGGAAPALVLSHALWNRAFGEDEDVVGRTLRLLVGDHEAYRVVGVLPENRDYPESAEAYVVGIAAFDGWGENRRFEAHVLARLAPGVDAETARAELTSVYAGLTREDSRSYPEMEVVVEPLLDTVVGDVRSALWSLFAAVGLVLAIAAANLAGLFLLRGAEREQEIAIRTALGASRLDLVRQLATETLVLAPFGLGLGLLLAGWGVALVKSFGSLPRTEAIGVDPTVVAFAFAVTLLAALGAGVVPAWRASRRSLRARAFPEARAMSALVVLELALALVLVAGAALLGKSLAAQLDIARGVRSEGLVLAAYEVPRTKYAVFELIALTDRVLDRVSALPNVASVTPVSARPTNVIGGVTAPFRIEGESELEARTNPYLNMEVANESYFETLGIPILRGRSFLVSDRGNDHRVAIVGASFARRAWPGEDPIGRRFSLGNESPWLTVVGVAGDTRTRELMKAWLEVYVPAGQSQFPDGFVWFSPSYLVVRTTASAEAIAPSLRSAVREIDPDVPVDDVVALDAVFDEEVARPRLHALGLGAFALVALLLAAVGVYAILAVLASSRRREIGIRLAVGATPSEAVRVLLAHGVKLSAIGTVLGLAGGAAAVQVLASRLYAVSPLDPASFAAAGGVLLAVGIISSYVPARRASRTDPAVVLRHE